EAMIAQVEALIRQRIPPGELDQILADMGIPPGWNALYSQNAGPHASVLLVSLARAHKHSTAEYIDRIRADLRRRLPGIKFGFQTGGMISDVLNFGLPAPVDIKISGAHLGQLHETAVNIRQSLAAIAGATDVRVLQGMHTPEL